MSSFNVEDLITLEESFKDVIFYSKNHTYKIGNKDAKCSVTGLLKNHSPEFPREKMAGIISERDGLRVDEVLALWDFKRDYSSHKGSEFHLFAENYIERKQNVLDKEALQTFLKNNNSLNLTSQYYTEVAHLIKNFLNFYKWYKENYFLVKSEFVVGDPKSLICGTVDNISLNKKTKKLELFDYKTNKSILKKNPRDEHFLEPIAHLPYCDHIKYSLQLWIYRLIIEQNTGFEVDNTHIVWVGDKNDFQILETLNVKREAEELLNKNY